ncbi:aminotransferase class V-fold PLP-dependent enzyme [Litorilinea aerophila]|uniref:Aminotransferase class V-fold PLP-dependent enzyme n=1 Tax=Litorilinea aerophila TaxID=1204385 RepID=A0A540VIE0_9CHLR|nr:aminotransferase class V-fold PLP-dependent enzyme [Litorilinea aerophila]MCC9075764.1 aminotransferase class V-fold PLP-dependent enzyme [Litorilinea aerophila]
MDQNMDQDLHKTLQLRRVINASGTLTAYGQSAVLPAAAEAACAAMSLFFEMDVLQARASALIARVTGAEAGMVTACASAGITLAVAACMTGTDPARIAQLPDTAGMRDEVLLQMGHAVNYGAPVTQAVRLAGAQVRLVGTVNSTPAALLDTSFTDRTAAALFVVSHHTIQYGYVPLPRFVEIAHGHGVPVVVDAAAEEHMLPKLIATGADLVICSGHKHFRAPTSGLMAGRLDLIQAAYAQNRGIGRGMKVGKEGIVGLMAALEAWEQGYHQAQQEAEQRRIRRMVERLRHLEGIQVREVWPEPDPYPIMRARVTVDPEGAGLNAMALSVLLADGDPTIKVRGHHVEEGYFLIDPFNLSDEEAEFICERIEAIARLPLAEKQAIMQELAGLSSADLWARGGEWPFL